MKQVSELHVEQLLKDGGTVHIRQAVLEDVVKIQDLYHHIYRGDYPLSVVTDYDELVRTITGDEAVWMVIEDGDRLVGSVIYLIDHRIRIAKAFAAVILPEYRGNDLTEKTMCLVEEAILREDGPCDVVYATTRTYSPAPQKLTAKLGYKRLGIFPNVHKVRSYETHGLAARFAQHAFEMRRKQPVILPELEALYNVVRKDLEFGEALIDNYEQEPYEGPLITFEAVDAPHFVKSRFYRAISTNRISMRFFPFLEPNFLLVSPDQEIEVYLYYEKADGHACIIGGHFPGVDYCKLLRSVTHTGKELGMRYLEILVGAYKPKRQRAVLNARFLPSAFFPAMRYIGEGENYSFYTPGERLDYFVFSRSFEPLDFNNLRLEGINKIYLRYYYVMWKKLFIDETLG